MLILLLALTQDAAPYVPISHWGMPYIEHWIARGVVHDPTPLTRPFTRPDLVAALAAVDTTGLSPGERRVWTAIRLDLQDPERGAAVRLGAHLGATGATYTTRDPLRERGPDWGSVAGGASLELRLGPVAAVTHPYFDTRLTEDPEYQGIKSRTIAGRNAEAYVDARWSFGELFFGIADRNWGPTPLEGLIVSPSPYGYDHFLIRLGTSAVRIEGLLTQLDDMDDTAGVPNHRYWVAHRLWVRPSRRVTFALWEGTLVTGADRELEPWFTNILNLGLLAQYDQGESANTFLGADLEVYVGRTRLYGSVLVDDIQVDDATATDQEPPQYGFTLGAQGGVGRWDWTGFYTQVANLTYRTENPVDVLMRRSVGLGRNYSDYDQLTLRAGTILGPVWIGPEVTLLRQGEGDFRDPYPPVSAFPTTPTVLSGVVERTVRVALGARWDSRRFGARAEGGIHLVHNAGHVTDATASRFVGSVALEYRLTWSRPLP